MGIHTLLTLLPHYTPGFFEGGTEGAQGVGTNWCIPIGDIFQIVRCQNEWA